ncbi:MAG: cupin domain-containing protein [Halobacteriales archaeon]|nr:cupin domain-containing protein [Halobacteriales archaeon]
MSVPDYRTVAVDELPDAPNPTRHKKEVDEAVGATAFGFNVYEAEPGELVPWAAHRHPDHEELFYVLEGELAVETPDGEFAVGAGEAFFVPADAPNSARAAGEGRTRLVAVGAPKDADGAVIEEPCPACGELTRWESSRDGEIVVLHCSDCGAETRRFGAGPDG